MTKIEELKAAFDAATQEEWLGCGDGAVWKERSTIQIAQCYITSKHDQYRANATFIALSHNLMSQLLEAIELVEQLELGNTEYYDLQLQARKVLEKLK